MKSKYYQKYLKYKNKYLKLKGGLNNAKNFGNSLVNTITSTVNILNPTHERDFVSRVTDPVSHVTGMATLGLIEHHSRDICLYANKQRTFDITDDRPRIDSCKVSKDCRWDNEKKCYLVADKLCQEKKDCKAFSFTSFLE